MWPRGLLLISRIRRGPIRQRRFRSCSTETLCFDDKSTQATNPQPFLLLFFGRQTQVQTQHAVSSSVREKEHSGLVGWHFQSQVTTLIARMNCKLKIYFLTDTIIFIWALKKPYLGRERPTKTVAVAKVSSKAIHIVLLSRLSKLKKLVLLPCFSEF